MNHQMILSNLVLLGFALAYMSMWTVSRESAVFLVSWCSAWEWHSYWEREVVVEMSVSLSPVWQEKEN